MSLPLLPMQQNNGNKRSRRLQAAPPVVTREVRRSLLHSELGGVACVAQIAALQVCTLDGRRDHKSCSRVSLSKQGAHVLLDGRHDHNRSNDARAEDGTSRGFRHFFFLRICRGFRHAQRGYFNGNVQTYYWAAAHV